MPEPIQWNENAPSDPELPSGPSDDVSILTTFTKEPANEEQFGDRIVPVQQDRYVLGLPRDGGDCFRSRYCSRAAPGDASLTGVATRQNSPPLGAHKRRKNEKESEVEDGPRKDWQLLTARMVRG